jgi:hypothetical protein
MLPTLGRPGASCVQDCIEPLPTQLHDQATGRRFVQITSYPDKEWLRTRNSHCIPKTAQSPSELFGRRLIRQCAHLDMVPAPSTTLNG